MRMADEEQVLDNLTEIRRKIAESCTQAERDPSSVTLMAVTKTVPPEKVNAVIAAGVTLLGENRVQEYLSKAEKYLPTAEIHMIGHLQTNKVRQIIDKVSMIESVDSLHLAETIDRLAEQKGLVMPVLVEVNIGGEISKSGVSPKELPALLQAVEKLPHIKLRGLMTIPPPAFTEEEQGSLFSEMEELFGNMQKLFPLDTLSMGMSGDYPSAILHGATIVRIGSALFGKRSYQQASL